MLAILIAVILTVGLSFIPELRVITYPLQLWDTAIHELSHAAAALLTGGSVVSIQVNSDASGVTWTSGGFKLLITTAGYLGTTVTGLWMALMSGVARYGSRVALLIIGLAGIFLTVESSSVLTAIVGALLATGALVLAFSNERSGRAVDLVCAFMGVQLICDSIYDLKHLIYLSGTHTVSDAQIMESQTGVPAIFWAVLWMGIALVAVVYVAYRRLA